MELKKREDELQHSINELDAKKTELQETTTDSNQHVAEFQETNANLEMEQEIVMLMNDLSTPPPNIANSAIIRMKMKRLIILTKSSQHLGY